MVDERGRGREAEQESRTRGGRRRRSRRCPPRPARVAALALAPALARVAGQGAARSSRRAGGGPSGMSARDSSARAHDFSLGRLAAFDPGRCGAACRAAPRLRPCAAAPPSSPVSSCSRSARSLATACGAKPEPTSGKLDTTYPASARDGSNRIITVEAPPRLVLVVNGGPQRTARAPGRARRRRSRRRDRRAHPGGAPRSRGRRARRHRRGRASATPPFIRKLPVPVFVMPGARLEDIERAAVALGVLTNHAEAGRALALKLRKQRQDIARRLEGVAPLNVYVDAGFGTSIQRTTLLARLLQLAGARLVGPSNGIATVNARLLHRLDPDAYVATSTSGVTLARLRGQPRLRTLRAVTPAASSSSTPPRRERTRPPTRSCGRSPTRCIPRSSSSDALRRGHLRRDGDARRHRAAGAAPAALARAAPRAHASTSRAARERCGSRCATTARTASAAHDAPSLAALRLECASLLADALALDVSGADVLPSLTDAISFYAYPDALRRSSGSRPPASSSPSSQTGTSRCTTCSRASASPAPSRPSSPRLPSVRRSPIRGRSRSR